MVQRSSLQIFIFPQGWVSTYRSWTSHHALCHFHSSQSSQSLPLMSDCNSGPFLAALMGFSLHVVGHFPPNVLPTQSWNWFKLIMSSFILAQSLNNSNGSLLEVPSQGTSRSLGETFSGPLAAAAAAAANFVAFQNS